MRFALPLAFLIGLVLKVLHLPYHTVFLLVVLGAGLIWGVACLVRTTDKEAGWTVMAVWAWAAHLVAVLKLFPFRTATLLLALAFTAEAAYLLLKSGGLRSPWFRALLGSFTVVMLVMARPVSSRFFATNLAFSVERDTDYRSWDKYSFFLLREDRLDEALDANGSAIEAAMTTHDEAVAELLRARRATIETRSWDRYTPLGH